MRLGKMITTTFMLGSMASTLSHAEQHSGLSSKSEEELLLFFDEHELIITATKQPQELRQAPAIASVITGHELRSMGARHLMDALRIVPGISVDPGSAASVFKVIEVRGIEGSRNEKIKLLVDGHSVNVNLWGGFINTYGRIPVDHVSRIEVIRGPGSALYGSNAFSAVINVITKDGAEMDGVTLAAGGGSFDTGRGYLLAGGVFDQLDASLSVQYSNTEGDRRKIPSDVIGTSGTTDDFEDRLDTQFKLSYEGYSLNAGYSSVKRGPYLGVAFAVNNDTKLNYRQYYVDVGYNKTLLDDTANLTAKVYYDFYDHDQKWEIFSEGALPGLPEGMVGQPLAKERTIGGELQFDYHISSTNLVTLGAMWEKRRQFDVRAWANFNPITSAPLGSFQDVTSWGNWNRDANRYIKAFYLQDIWNISNELDLTLGARYDDYSDFGSSVNPRAALVWRFMDDWDLKVLYGSAFRAPTFEELYNINNPVVIGNPDLDAERMRTMEVSLGGRLLPKIDGRVTYFHNRIKDQIRGVLQPDGITVFDNAGGARVYGIEAELKGNISRQTSLYANYTYLHTRDDDTDRRLPNVAEHKGNIGANLALNRHWNINANLFLSAHRSRMNIDSRNHLPGYGLVDLTVIAKNYYPGFEFRGSIKNLFDKQYATPAPPMTVRDDYPQDGISVLAEVQYKF